MTELTPEADVTLSTEEMMEIRNTVRARLLHDYHAHLLTARLWKRLGNTPMSKVDEARAHELNRMLSMLADEPEPPHGTSIRLREGPN